MEPFEFPEPMSLDSCFIFVGEHSGDLHASALMAAMRRIKPAVEFSGVGGPLMQREGLHLLFPFEEMHLFGAMEILWRLPSLIKRFYQTCDWILRKKPDAVILVDSPEWNLRLGISLRRAGYSGRIIYYIAPTVWAWRKGRIKQLEKFADLLLCIFPFELPYFKGSPFLTQFVGHPLLDRIAQEPVNEAWRESCGIPEAKRALALFPGSRRSEIDRLFPRMLEVTKQLKRNDPELQIMISSADTAFNSPIQDHLQRAQLMNHPSYVCVPSAHRYAMMRSAQCALAKSGTVTLELALHGVPSAVVYDLSPCDRWIAWYLARIRLPFYCIVNILAGTQVYPEWVKEPFQPHLVAKELLLLQEEGERRRFVIDACHKIREQLGAQEGKSASDRAAEAIFG